MAEDIDVEGSRPLRLCIVQNAQVHRDESGKGEEQERDCKELKYSSLRVGAILLDISMSPPPPSLIHYHQPRPSTSSTL